MDTPLPSPTDTPSSSYGDPRLRRAERRRTFWEDAVNVPNALTFMRVLMIPLVLWFLNAGTPKECFWATLTYSLAALTDLIDGWLARRQGLVTVFGKFLDPLADKLIVMAALIWLIPLGRIAPWVVVVLLAREISVTALRSIAMSEGLVLAAGESGKTKTALQMVGILCLMLGYPYHLSFGPIDFGMVDTVRVGRVLLYISLVYSMLSAAGYFGLFVDAVEAKNRRLERGP